MYFTSTFYTLISRMKSDFIQNLSGIKFNLSIFEILEGLDLIVSLWKSPISSEFQYESYNTCSIRSIQILTAYKVG